MRLKLAKESTFHALLSHEESSMVIKPSCPIFYNNFTGQLITLNTLDGKLKAYDISIKYIERTINIDGSVYIFTSDMKVYRLNGNVKELDIQ